MKLLTLFNADGVGCVVEASDIITIADGQCVTDAIVDFHNVWVDPGSHYSLMIVPSPKRLLRATSEDDTAPLELILLDSYGTHRDDPSVFDGVKLFLELTAKDLHPECDATTLVTALRDAKPVPMKVLVDTDFKTLRSYLYLEGVSALEMRRAMRGDLCMHATDDLVPALVKLGVVVPKQPAPRVAKHGAVVDSGGEDGNTKLTRMQVEHYGMKRDLVIWKAAVTAVGAAMGYSVDQLLAGAAHVLQAQDSEGEAATPGCSRSTAPSTPNPRAGARPSVTDSPSSKGDPHASVAQCGAGLAKVELGVVHPSPCVLPVLATPIWSLKGTPGSVPITHQAKPSVVHAGGTRPVVLAMPAKRKRDATPPSGSDVEGDVQSADVVDLLPGPIWHIIFRHLLAHHSPEKQGDSSGASQQEARSTSNATALPFPAITDQHAKALRRFGPSWPLLRYAVASKRLLLHAISFSVSHLIMMRFFPSLIPPYNFLLYNSSQKMVNSAL
ncbi:unnamed protein product [Closterium sp. Naga37s-1]|nr:unnamed protein product [Closterium sp. Naga37s-1]